MKLLKVVTVVGTRPELIRLSRLISKLDKLTDHTLVHTGQNSDPNLSDVFLKDLEIRRPDVFLDVDTSSLASVLGGTLLAFENVLEKVKPDAVMILGDTNSAIASLIAERQHVPVYHMEAGNRSFDPNVPEELNRRMVDHISSFNLPYNNYSYQNLIREGIDSRTMTKTGSPMLEVLTHYAPKIDKSKILDKLRMNPKGYFLVSLHRQENVDYPWRLSSILKSIEKLRESWPIPVLVSTHPRTRKQLQSSGGQDWDGFVFHEPFGFLDYIKLQKNAFCVLSDSGTISEESAILGFPAVTIRDFFERPEGLENASIILSAPQSHLLETAIRFRTSILEPVELLPDGYEVDNFSDRVVNFLFSTIHQSKFRYNSEKPQSI